MAAHQTKAEVMVIEFEYRVQSRAAAREDVIMLMLCFSLIIKGSGASVKDSDDDRCASIHRLLVVIVQYHKGLMG